MKSGINIKPTLEQFIAMKNGKFGNLYLYYDPSVVPYQKGTGAYMIFKITDENIDDLISKYGQWKVSSYKLGCTLSADTLEVIPYMEIAIIDH